MACISPIFLKLDRPKYYGNQPIYSVDIACGKCGPCIKRRINQWAFRLLQEDFRSVSCFFTTLTYDTEHVPLTPRCNMTLDRRTVLTKNGNRRTTSHLQDFFKRLRYYHETDGIYIEEIQRGTKIPRLPIKYYACGEYGGLFGRPHYHAIIFNCFPDAIEKAWTYGNIKTRPADTASIFYTLKYMEKSLTDVYSYDPDIVKEFSLKSKGLGDNYISVDSLDFHSNHIDNNYVTNGMHKIALPKYYSRKFWPDSKDENGRTLQHPHKLELLAHIKYTINKEKEKLELSEGSDHYKMEIMRANFHNVAHKSHKNRLF